MDSTIGLIFYSPLQFTLKAIGVVTIKHNKCLAFKSLIFG
ncbi:hypothetical protein EMIT0180MI3_10659 [Priestia megaterium]